MPTGRPWSVVVEAEVDRHGRVAGDVGELAVEHEEAVAAVAAVAASAHLARVTYASSRSQNNPVPASGCANPSALMDGFTSLWSSPDELNASGNTGPLKRVVSSPFRPSIGRVAQARRVASSGANPCGIGRDLLVRPIAVRRLPRPPERPGPPVITRSNYTAISGAWGGVLAVVRARAQGPY